MQGTPSSCRGGPVDYWGGRLTPLPRPRLGEVGSGRSQPKAPLLRYQRQDGEATVSDFPESAQPLLSPREERK